MIYKCANAYYFGYINKIGGIESHLYYIARKYGNYDITIFYRDGDNDQLTRLKKYVRCIQIKPNDHVICKKMFCCFNREILNQCEANEKILVLHGDYKDMVERGQLNRKFLPIDERIDRYIGVSQLVCDSWKEITGINAENVYQPIVLNKVDRPLMFVSATRLTIEKGWDRMVKLANELDKHKVNYTWLIFTDSTDKKPTKNMIFCKPRLDITDKLKSFDAFIQLSDNEGYCLSVVEALTRGVPIICTDLPVLHELGINEKNSITLDFKMDDIPIQNIKEIYKMHFKYEIPEDKWGDILVKKQSTYEGEKYYKVKALSAYRKFSVKDRDLNYIPREGEIFIITEERYKELTKMNRFHQPFVELVEIIKGDINE